MINNSAGVRYNSTRSHTPPARRSVKFQLDKPVRKYDSVDSIMDKIDTELSGIQVAPAKHLGGMICRRPRSLSSSRTTATQPISQFTNKSETNKDKSSRTTSTDTGLRFNPLCKKVSHDWGAMSMQEQSQQSSLNITDLINNNSTLPEQADGRLDLTLATQLNAEYSEILASKQAKLGEATSLQHSYSPLSGSNSVCTEDFELAFLQAAVTAERTANQDQEDGSSVKSLDTPRTEDFEEAFNSTLVKQAAPNPTLANLDSKFLSRKLKETGAVDSTDVTNFLNNYHQEREDTTLTMSGQANYDASSESEFDGELAREIKAESCRIQKEIELERKANKLKHSTPIKTPSVSSKDSTPTTVISNSNIQSRMSQLSTSSPDTGIIESLNNEKLRLLEDISNLKNTLQILEQEVVLMEQRSKANRARAEEARSHMMLAEFKKNEILKEFTELSNELERGRKLQEAIKMETQKSSAGNNTKISDEELGDLLSERNQLRALLDNRNSATVMEKNELELHLNSAKQELFAEQKRYREEVDTYNEKINDLSGQLRQAVAEKESKSLEIDSVRAKIDKLERQLRDSEKLNLQAIIDRDKELEILKESAQRDTFELRIHLNNELTNTKKLLQISEDKIVKLQQELHNRDIVIQEMRDECLMMQNRATDEEANHDKMIRALQKELKALEEAKNDEIQRVKQQMEIEQIGLLDATRSEMEQQHEEVLITMKEDYNSQLVQQQQLINGKDEEICLLRSRLSQQEEAGRKLAERLKIDSKLQLEQAVRNERQMWEKEQRHVEGSQIKHIREEAEKQHEQLREDLDNEQRRCRQLDDQYRALKAELEEQRQQNQKLYQEKLVAISKSKQVAQEELSLQVEKMRQHMEEDTDRILDRLKEEMLMKDEEIRCLRSECHDLHQLDADLSITIEKLEKMVVGEINDECRKTAHLLGVTPRKTQSTGLNVSGSPPENSHRRARTIVASAIANLRACNEELRNTVKELKEDAESLQTALHKTKKSRDKEIEQLRKQLNKDKQNDMDELKQRLTQIVSTQQSVLDLLEISPSSLLEPDAHSTDIDSEDSESEHKMQIDHICALVSDQSAYSRLLKMRDQELKDVHKHMSTWKDQTANKMADKFSEELYGQLKLYLLRLDQKLADNSLKRSLKDSVVKGNSSLEFNGDRSYEDVGASPKLRQSVSERVRQLRAGSPSKRTLALSTPDLSKQVGINDGLSSALEQRVKLAELKAHLAEERAARNQTLLSQKLQEVNQLQNVLNSQTKEILSLEKSFEEMKNPTYS